MPFDCFRASLIVAFVGNSKAHNGASGFATDVVDFAREIQNLAANVTLQLQGIPGAVTSHHKLSVCQNLLELISSRPPLLQLIWLTQ